MRIIFLRLCYSIACFVFFVQFANAQASEKIHHFEYFFDTDPGFGSATQVTVPTPSVNVSNLNFTPSIAALSNGLHTLHVRAVDSLYRRSLTRTQMFYKEALVSNTAPNIISAEYFYDTDPGFGNATTVAVTSGQTITFNFSGSIAVLSNGLHNLFVRTLDANGNWSKSTPKLFYKESANSGATPNIVAAEYFFDTDPGFGNATSASVTAGTTVTFNFSGSITSLTNGLHNLFVRTLDANGKWSKSIPKIFYKESIGSLAATNLIAAEYFFDTDPGFGNATAAGVTAGTTVTFSFAGNIATLTNGLHNLFVRTKDANGKWSISTAQLFYKDVAINNPAPNIVAAEYFFDTDPGFGNATTASVTAGTTVTFNFSGSITSLTNGLHNLFVRTKDVNGKWSISTAQLFYKEAAINNPAPNIVAAEYFFDTDPGFGNATAASVTAGTTVTFSFSGNIAALTNGLHNLFVRTKDVNGKWSISTAQLFYKEPAINNPIPNIVAAEYYIDSDPGFGNATAITVSPQGQTITQAFSINATLLSKGLHRLYIRVKDVNGKWSITHTAMFYYEMALPINPTDQFVKLEWFWTTDPGFGNATAVSIPPGNNGQITNFAFNVPVTAAFSGTKKNLYIRVLDDWSLTTVKVVDFTNIALPVTLLEFTAVAKENIVVTKWATAQEINSDYFDVEHSTDGINFTAIGKVTAAGNSSIQKEYLFNHNNPVIGNNFYRLKQFDKNGIYTFSPVVMIIFSGVKGNIVCYPNPVIDILTIKVPLSFTDDANLTAQIFDSKGALIDQKAILKGSSTISMQRYPSGSYSLVVTNKTTIVYKQIVIKK